MIYSRINLEKTNYSKYELIWSYTIYPDITKLNDIYKTYCRYKKFKSFMPIFDSEYRNNEIISYRHHGKLVAWSMIAIHDDENIESYQFAWDYANPELRLGIKSLKNECAIYKERGYKYFYLGDAAKYKMIDGYEELGPC